MPLDQVVKANAKRYYTKDIEWQYGIEPHVHIDHLVLSSFYLFSAIKYTILNAVLMQLIDDFSMHEICY